MSDHSELLFHIISYLKSINCVDKALINTIVNNAISKDGKYWPVYVDFSGNLYHPSFEQVYNDYSSKGNKDDEGIKNFIASLSKAKATVNTEKSDILQTFYKFYPFNLLYGTIDFIDNNNTLNSLYYFRNYNLLKIITCHLFPVYCILFDYTGARFISGSDDNLVKIYNTNKCILMHSLRGHTREITDIVISNNNTLIAAASTSGEIIIYNFDGKILVLLKSHTNSVQKLLFKNSSLFSASLDGTCKIWNLTDLNNVTYETIIFPDIDGHKNECSTLDFINYNNKNYLICATNTGKAYVYSLDLKLVNTLDNRSSVSFLSKYVDLFVISTNHSNTNVLIASEDGIIRIWKIASIYDITLASSLTMISRSSFQPNFHPTIYSAVWSYNDDYIIACSSESNSNIKIWSSTDFILQYNLNGHSNLCQRVLLHPIYTSVFVSVGLDGKVIFWNMVLGRIIKIFTYNDIKFLDCNFSPSGEILICSTMNGTLYYFSNSSDEKDLKSPNEQFFTTDYKPVISDRNDTIIDQEYLIPPHLCPKNLCDAQGFPYNIQPNYQYKKTLIHTTKSSFPRINEREQDLVPFITSNNPAVEKVSRLKNHQSNVRNIIPSSSDEESEDEHSSFSSPDVKSNYEVEQDSVFSNSSPSSDTEEEEPSLDEESESEAPTTPPRRSTRNLIRRYRSQRSNRSLDYLPESKTSRRYALRHHPRRLVDLVGENGSEFEDIEEFKSPAVSHNHFEEKETPTFRASRTSKKNIEKNNKNLNLYRNCAWLSQSIPSREYVPQCGDVVMYLREGHKKFLSSFIDSNIHDKSLPFNKFPFLPTAVPCLIQNIEYHFIGNCNEVACLISLQTQIPVGPPNRRAKRITRNSLIRSHEENSFDDENDDCEKILNFSIIFSRSSISDFIVLMQNYQTGINHKWSAGDKCKVFFSDVNQYYSGEITSYNNHTKWESVTIRWDDGDQNAELSHLNPWELKPIEADDSSNSVSSNSKNEVDSQILEILQNFMSDPLFKIFREAVCIHSFPSYPDLVPVPIDLSLIVKRIESNYYRHSEAICSDITLIRKNTEIFNLPESIIVIKSKVLESNLLKKFISLGNIILPFSSVIDYVPPISLDIDESVDDNEETSLLIDQKGKSSNNIESFSPQQKKISKFSYYSDREFVPDEEDDFDDSSESDEEKPDQIRVQKSRLKKRKRASTKKKRKRAPTKKKKKPKRKQFSESSDSFLDYSFDSDYSADEDKIPMRSKPTRTSQRTYEFRHR